jgi:hypothetical protein
LIGFSAPDQHGTVVTFRAGDARVILFDTPAATGASQPSPDPDRFAKNHVLPVVNISDLSFLKHKVAQTRMAAKTYPLLVVDDKSIAGRFPVQHGKFTLLFLSEQGVITNIRFATPGKLRELLASRKQPAANESGYNSVTHAPRHWV